MLASYPRASLVWRAWIQALRTSAPPVEFLAFRLFEPDAAETSQWLFSWESIALAGQLTDRQANELAGDKAAFADWCRTLNVRAIPTIALATARGWDRSMNTTLPEHDLLIKPRRGSKGTGIAVWRWCDGSFTCKERQLTPQALADHLVQSAASQGDLLIQPLLTPHNCLGAIAGIGMPAVRIISARRPDGRVEIGPAMLQAPEPGETISQSGPFRLVNTQTGAVLNATERQSLPVFDMAMGSGFDGIQLPQWPLVIAMLQKAHGHFPGRIPVIGWDVLFDREGPVISEANTSLSYYFFQFASAEPMANSTIGKVFEAYL